MSRLYPCVYCTEDGYCKKYSDEEVTSWCVQSPCKDEKPSNADRIRAMSVEEMAEFLRVVGGCGPCHDQAYCKSMPRCEDNCWQKWLKEEAGDGQTP